MTLGARAEGPSTASLQAEPGWKLFSPEAGGFKALFPGEPIHLVEKPARSSHPTRILRYRSRALEFESEEVHMHLVGRDLFLVTARSRAREADLSMMQRFLGSFRLLDRD